MIWVKMSQIHIFLTNEIQGKPVLSILQNDKNTTTASMQDREVLPSRFYKCISFISNINIYCNINDY